MRQVGEDQVVVMAPQEGVLLAMLALLSPGDHVVCTYPGYQSLYEASLSSLRSPNPICQCHSQCYGRPRALEACTARQSDVRLASSLQVARALGCRVSNWEVSQATDGSLSFDAAQLQQLITPHTKLVVVNFPHNPTGECADRRLMYRFSDAP